jgi:hypothetical protein
VAYTAKDDKDKDDKDDDDVPEADLKEPKFQVPGETGVVHRAVWDLTYPGANFIPKARVDSGDPTQGPLVPPGEYTVRLTVDGQAQSTKLVVRPDPRFTAEWTAQDRFARQIHGDFAKLVGTVQQLRGVRKQLDDRNDLVEGDAKAETLTKGSRELIAKLDALEEKLHNPKARVTYDIFAAKGGAKLYSQFAFLFDTVKAADGPPTQGMREVYAEIAAELGRLAGEFQALVDGDLAKLNEQAKQLELPVVIVPAVKPSAGKAAAGSRRWAPAGRPGGDD